jgi:HSP20 family protein
VNSEDVSADYSNGVLKIKLGKRAEAKPKQIKVNIGSGPLLEGKKGQAA